MDNYENYSKEELILRIHELESTKESQPRSQVTIGRFRERYMREILDSLPDMLSVLDVHGTVVDLVSAEQTNHTGVSLKALLGHNVDTILKGESLDRLRENLTNVFSSKRGSTSHHDITIQEQTRYYENRIFPLDETYALCMCRDVTDAEQDKHELEMVKYALNNIEEVVYACDLDGTMEYVNEPFRQRHKITDSLSNHHVYEFWGAPSNAQQWHDRLELIHQDHGSHKYTTRFKDEQGKIVAWDIVSYIIFDRVKKREIVWFFGRDASQRLLHEGKVREMNAIMNSILNNIPVYLFVKDPGDEFRYLYWNKAFAEYSNIPTEKALGKTDFEIFPNPYDAEHFRKDDLLLLRDGERISYLEEYVTADGETRVVTTTKSLVSMEDRLPLIIGVSWDITERKNAELEIVEARIRAEESDKLKSAFLANMSHEIRTPLNAIVGFSKLIVEAETEEEKAQYADIVDVNSELLLQLINDILDISKIEAGTLEFKYKRCDLNELCRSEQEMHRTRLIPGVELYFDEKYPAAEIVCDQNRLSQVLTNLLTNAAKFTTKGQICFGFEMQEQEQSVHFYVKDSGIGIPANKVSQIFNRFTKLNDFAVGTGLGLAISKMIVEKMGGKISVESTDGMGTTFHFTIPICQIDDTGASIVLNEDASWCAMHANGHAWKILVVEPNTTDRLLLNELIGKRFDLINACNGADAVIRLMQDCPDVVLLDFKTSIQEACLVARQLREQAPHIPIIAMLGIPSEEARARVSAVGCNDFVVKPLSHAVLNRKLNRWLLLPEVERE